MIMHSIQKLSFYDRAINKIEKKIIYPLFANYRRKKLINTDFTIISNNCWGGTCYEYFNIPKQSPTVGAYFYAEDYVKFCEKLKYYLSLDLKIIPATESKHWEDLAKKGENNVWVGVLDDVEIIFLHYPDKEEIIEKWERRVQRINWENIILKFSYQNNCSDELVRRFEKISEYPKICLVGDKIDNCEGLTLFPRSNGKEPIQETYNFDRYINIVGLLNSKFSINKVRDINEED